jgi:hypothetical protein
MEKISLRQNVIDLIRHFLFAEKFPNYDYLVEGILNLIDSMSAYKEEGKDLFPEIFITTNIESVLETLPFCKIVEIASDTPTAGEFEKILKLCAPLSKKGWVTFINVSDEIISYGLVSTEISELSPTFREQVIGELSGNNQNYAIVYLHNVGNKSVLLQGINNKAVICLALRSEGPNRGKELNKLCKAITKDMVSIIRDISTAYFEKIIGNATSIGHGNLVGVVKESKSALTLLRNKHPDGIYLSVPIDFIEMLQASEEQKTREASTVNQLYSSLLQSMLNHDGITIFTTKGRLIGYHLFVKSDGIEESDVTGGARSRAFEVMKQSQVFYCCFYKSQDGIENIWSLEND